MTPENFMYWLQGFFELQTSENAKTLNEKQVQIIKEHMALVITKVTPTSMDDGDDDDELERVKKKLEEMDGTIEFSPYLHEPGPHTTLLCSSSCTITSSVGLQDDGVQNASMYDIVGCKTALTC